MADESKDQVKDDVEETEATSEETPEEAPEETPEESPEETSDEAPEEAAEESAEEPEHAEPSDEGDGGPVPFSSTGPDGPADGMAAFFVHPMEILDAAEKARDESLEKWDVFTPFPIHGMDEAMGIGRSWIPWVTFAAAMTGLTTALTIQIGTMYFDWQIIIGGKPYLPWPSYMPITFELSVLFAGITTALVMFWACGLPTLKPKVIDWRITRDRFVLWIDAKDPSYDPVKTREFLEGLDPLEIREVRFDA